MKQALSLAQLALGQVSPNPAVGAVIVKDGEVVGQGYTQPPGSAHAEIVALCQAGEKARGGVMYVTLEPCCHYGHTPPCTSSIIAAGISEVHFAMIDPNPLVAGKGQAALEKAGIRTIIGDCEAEAKELNEAFIKHITTGMPFVTVKFAMSLDGKIATRSGDSHWISGEQARRYVHHLRYIADAIMAGANTVIIDNPHLTCRYQGTGGRINKKLLRVIVDGRVRTPPAAQIFRESGETLLAVGEDLEPERKEALIKAGAELMELPSRDGMLELKTLLKELGKRGITSVLVEGGGMLLGSLFDAHLVDKVVAFISPVVIGGMEAKTPVAGRGVTSMAQAFHLERVGITQFDNDVMVTGYMGRAECSPA